MKKSKKIKRVLHMALLAPGQPNGCISPAFSDCGIECYEMNWLVERKHYGLDGMRQRLVDSVKGLKPDFVFMQLQTDGIIDNSIARELSRYTRLINWTGDVREDIEWYAKLADSIFLTLFTNMTDVKKLMLRGKRSDYLQIGYDTGIYNGHDYPDMTRPRMKHYPQIAFCGNNYANFPLSRERADMVKFMHARFGKHFMNFGNGWPGTHHIDSLTEAHLYRNIPIAINQNHFEYELFSSDRILRIMACGAMCLTRWFPGIEQEYKDGVNVVVWKDFQELYDKATYYMHYRDKAEKIACKGQRLVMENYTWQNRIQQLLKLIKKWDN